MQTDRIFTEASIGNGEFVFDENVASVFDDMIIRSVPLYTEVQRLVPALAQMLNHDPLRVVDLGCSTGTSLIHLARSLPDRNLELIGVDNSQPMLDQCRSRLEKFDLTSNVSLIHEDIESFDFSDASVVLMNYTLQFVGAATRPSLLRRIHDSIRSGGFIMVSEKVCHQQPEVDQALIELYFEFKRRNGYSELEIARKRDALENVLVPCTVSDNRQMLIDAGFNRVELLLKWFNFATFVGFV